jgi:hypothetical protein
MSHTTVWALRASGEFGDGAPAAAVALGSQFDGRKKMAQSFAKIRNLCYIFSSRRIGTAHLGGRAAVKKGEKNLLFFLAQPIEKADSGKVRESKRSNFICISLFLLSAIWLRGRSRAVVSSAGARVGDCPLLAPPIAL